MGKRGSRYQFTGYSKDEDLAEAFHDFAEDFSSESQAVMHCIRQQLAEVDVDD